MRKKLLPILILVLLLAACRNETAVSTSYETPETWADLFTIFWEKMSSNYVFWALDYDEGSLWEDVYEDYLPLFEELGDIGDGAFSTACRYLYEITSPLSDGHYYVDITDGNDMFSSYPGMRRALLSYRCTDDQIFSLFSSWDGEYFTSLYDEEYNLDLSGDYSAYAKSLFECQTYMKEYVLALDTNGSSSTYSDFSARCLTNGTGTIYSIIGSFHEDNIAYFGLSNFLLYPYVVAHDRDIMDFLMSFQSVIRGADGVIIDLRGNSGGYLTDLQYLWPSFTGGNDVHFADSRRKDGDNRLDYGLWLDLTVEDEGLSFDSGTPIAVLVNRQSASAAELSVMFFKALRDYYGYNVRIIGETTAGANGTLVESYSEEYYNAGTTSIDPYMTTIYTPFSQVRYRDGTIYEGVGIEPDETIVFDYEEFISGTDRKLERALEWIRAEIN